MTHFVQFTEAEMDALEAALDDVYSKELTKLHGKMVAAVGRAKAKPTGPSLREVEEALVATSKGRYVPWVAGNPSALLKMWYAHRPTMEQVDQVGRWLSTWKQGMTATFGTVARKWPEYLARAQGKTPEQARKLPAGFVDGVDW